MGIGSEQPLEIDPVSGYQETLDWYENHAVYYAERISGIEPPEIRSFADRLPASAKVLDAGCAAGRDTAFFVGKGFIATGLDITQTFIDLARAKYPDIDFVHGDILCLPFPDSFFDGVCLRSVLLHLPDSSSVERALSEAARVAKGGALIFVRVKKQTSPAKFVKGIDVRTSSPRLFQLFRLDEICDLVQKAGLNIENAEESPDDDNPGVICINIFARKKRQME